MKWYIYTVFLSFFQYISVSFSSTTTGLQPIAIFFVNFFFLKNMTRLYFPQDCLLLFFICSIEKASQMLPTLQFHHRYITNILRPSVTHAVGFYEHHGRLFLSPYEFSLTSFLDLMTFYIEVKKYCLGKDKEGNSFKYSTVPWEPGEINTPTDNNKHTWRDKL